jgi:hypothetical protein
MLHFSRLLALAAIVACVSLLPAEDKKPTAARADDGFKPLFNGKNLDGWVNVNCHPDTFFVKDGEIITTGKPTGFLRYEKPLENFVLEFDWMHIEKEKMANSGLFVWGDPLPAVGTPYTRGIEVQVLINFAPKDGWATSHGDIFSIHGARCTPDRPHPTRPGMERCLPSENRVKGGGEWNHYKVTANNGVIKLEVNGKEVSGVSKSNPRKGYIALESEGAECHFKNIKMKELPSTSPKPEECANVWEGHVSLFSGLDLKGWKTADESWKANGGILKCAGKALLVSDGKYPTGELIFDWKLPAKSDKQVAASIGAATVTITGGKVQVGIAVDAAAIGSEMVETKAIKAGWNRTILTFDGKTATAKINGEVVAKVETKKTPPAGPVLFHDAEGAEFMNIFARELKEKK